MIRKLLLVAGAAALFVSILIVWRYLPPHLQIRSVEPNLPTAAQLRSLLATEGGPTRIQGFRVAEQSSPMGDFSHNVIAIDWDDQRTFLVDLAMDETGAAEFAATLQRFLDAGPGRYHADIASRLGDGTDRVTGVGFTHLHIDHVQGIHLFCSNRGDGATALQTSDQVEKHNFNTTEGAALVESSCLARRELEGDGVLPAPGFPGLALVPLGGHTPGSTLFAAAVDGHLWLFSGDTTNSKADLLEDRGKGFAYSWLLVPEHTRRTAELRRWLRDLDAQPDMTVVVSHDLDAAADDGLPSS